VGKQSRSPLFVGSLQVACRRPLHMPVQTYIPFPAQKSRNLGRVCAFVIFPTLMRGYCVHGCIFCSAGRKWAWVSSVKNRLSPNHQNRVACHRLQPRLTFVGIIKTGWIA